MFKNTGFYGVELAIRRRPEGLNVMSRVSRRRMGCTRNSNGYRTKKIC